MADKSFLADLGRSQAITRGISAITGIEKAETDIETSKLQHRKIAAEIRMVEEQEQLQNEMINIDKSLGQYEHSTQDIILSRFNLAGILEQGESGGNYVRRANGAAILDIFKDKDFQIELDRNELKEAKNKRDQLLATVNAVKTGEMKKNPKELEAIAAQLTVVSDQIEFLDKSIDAAMGIKETIAKAPKRDSEDYVDPDTKVIMTRKLQWNPESGEMEPVPGTEVPKFKPEKTKAGVLSEEDALTKIAEFDRKINAIDEPTMWRAMIAKDTGRDPGGLKESDRARERASWIAARTAMENRLTVIRYLNAEGLPVTEDNVKFILRQQR
ncbi:MAG: hypothetical protein ACW98Y_20200 [Candidatus Thorarchaeota archaeon]|jgi:hypothetical protein